MGGSSDAYRCGACRGRGVRVYEHTAPWFGGLRTDVRFLQCRRCQAGRLLFAEVEPWRGPELEAIALRPVDRATAGRDRRLAVELEAFADEG